MNDISNFEIGVFYSPTPNKTKKMCKSSIDKTEILSQNDSIPEQGLEVILVLDFYLELVSLTNRL